MVLSILECCICSNVEHGYIYHYSVSPSQRRVEYGAVAGGSTEAFLRVRSYTHLKSLENRKIGK